MPAKQTPTDMFIQFASLQIDLTGVLLLSILKNTGLSVRGGLMWLIHWVELYQSGGCVGLAAGGTEYLALSTLNGLPQIPNVGDKGLIAREDFFSTMVTTGASDAWARRRTPFFPPMPLAAPHLVFYARRNVSTTTAPVYCRVGYTTTHLEAKEYAEVAEVWAFV